MNENKQDIEPFSPDDISDWFWDIIARSEKYPEKLREILMKFEKDEIYRFQDEFLEAATQFKDIDYMQYISPHESEDGEDDICHWIVSQGKEYYTKIWENPKEIPYSIEMDNPEILFGIADEVYEDKFGELLPI